MTLGIRFNGHFRGPLKLTPLAAVTICFNNLGLSRLGIEHPTVRMRGPTLSSTAPQPRKCVSEYNFFLTNREKLHFEKNCYNFFSIIFFFREICLQRAVEFSGNLNRCFFKGSFAWNYFKTGMLFKWHIPNGSSAINYRMISFD